MAGTGYEIGQANIDAIIQTSLKILNNPNYLVTLLNKQKAYTIYKEETNGARMDDCDPAREPSVIEGNPKVPGQ